MHHIHKTIALGIALAAATSCKPETVTLGVTKHDDKAKAQEANQDPELIVLKSASGPYITHDKPSASIAHQGPISLEEIKSPISPPIESKYPVPIPLETKNDTPTAKDNKRQKRLFKMDLGCFSCYGSKTHVPDWEETPLHSAAERGNSTEIRALVQTSVAINAKDKDGWTPLHWATHRGHEDAVRLLLDSKADVNAKDSCKRTPLHRAIFKGKAEVIQLLLANGAQVNVKEHICGSTPLHWAVEEGHEDAVRLLLNKAKVNEKDSYKRTPLHRAARYGHIGVVRLLIDNKADINAKDKYGYTPLHWAACFGHKDVATLLIANGAQVNARNNDGKTPLGVAKAAPSWRNTEAAQALLRKHGGHE